MKMGFKLVSIALLCVMGMESVSASPFRGFGGREMFRVGRQQRMGQEPRQQIPGEGRRGLPEAPGNQARRGFEPEQNANQFPGQARQPGSRMTPEERRAMRRQINDAGHDIYSPQR